MLLCPQPRALKRKHGLELVATSWACEIRHYEHSKTAEEVLVEGDGMAVSVPDVRTTYQQLLGRAAANIPPGQQPSAPSTAFALVATGPTQPAAQQQQQPQQQQPSGGSALPGPLSNILSLPPGLTSVMNSNGSAGNGSGSGNGSAAQQPAASAPGGSGGAASASAQQQVAQGGGNGGSSNGGGGGGGGWASAAEMVAGMVGEAAAAASAAAVTPLASAAGSLYANLASLPIASALGAGPRSSAPAAAAALMAAGAAAIARSRESGGKEKEAGGTQQQQQQAEAARLAAAAGPAAIAAAPGGGTRLAAPTQSTTGSPACPSEWFVCDDEATCTRYFVVQGSDTIDHWKLNLTFDPVPFEDKELGIRVSTARGAARVHDSRHCTARHCDGRRLCLLAEVGTRW